MVITIFQSFCVYTFVSTTVGALPKLTSVSFDENFEKLLLTWDQDVRFNVSYRDCSAILNNQSMTILGTSPVCLMKSSKGISIILGIDAPIRMNDAIGMNPKIFGPGNVTIDAIAPFPNIVLKGPKLTCPCNTHYIYYNIDFSTLAGYGRLKATTWGKGDGGGGWKPTKIKKEDKDDTGEKKIILQPPDIDFPLIILVPPTPFAISQAFETTLAPTPPTTPTQEIETLESTYRKYNGLQEIRINSSLFEINGTYVMDVDTRNVLGERGSYQWHIKPQEDCKPILTVNKGSSLNRLEPIVFYAALTYPACWSGEKVPTYEWTFSEYVKFNTSSYLFFIGPMILDTNKLYTVTAKAKFKKFGSNDTMTASSYVSFKVDSQPLQARILGDYIETGWDGRFFASNLVKDLNAELAIPSYDWECKSNTQNRESFLVASNRILDISPKEKKFNMTEPYKCTFTYEKNKRKADDSIEVKFVLGVKPVLSVYSMKQSFCPQEKIFFTATLAGSTINDMVKYTWTCYDKYDGRQINLIPSSVTQTGSTKVVISGAKRQRFSTLEIPKNTIPFGITLTCRCQIQYTGVILSGTDSAMIDMPLRHTILSVYPPFGNFIETSFRARAHSWTLFGANKPLKFRFGYKRDENATTRYLSPWTSDNTLDDIYFPIIGKKPVDIIVVVEIINARKATSIATTTVQLFLNPIPPTIMPDIEHHIEIDQFKATQYVYNYLSNMNDVNDLATKADHKLNKRVIKYLEIVASAPMTAVGVENVFAIFNDFTNSTNGKVEKDVLMKMETVLAHVKDELWRNMKDDIDYVNGLKSILPMLNRILNEDSNHNYALNINTVHKLIYSYAAFACNSNSDILISPLSVSTSSISLSAYRERHISGDVRTPLTLSQTLVDTYSKQYCHTDSPCHGYCLTDASFIPKQYLNNTPVEGKGRYITEFRDMRIWRVGSGGKPVQISNQNERYLVYLDVTEEDVKPGDWIQCLVFGDTIETYMPSACHNATLIGGNGTYTVECDCSEVGLMTGYKPWTPPVILQPEPRLNYSFYFYAPAERCEGKLFDPFKPQFRLLLAAAINEKEKESSSDLTMTVKRIQILGCKPGSIIVEFYILDDTTEKQMRNSRIKEIVDEMILEENFKVKLNSNIFPMFDPNQTTPKPPTPTIPIGDVTVDWIPIVIAISVIFGFFLLIACLICLYNTHLLQKNIFTEINSDKIGEEEEEEKEESIEMVDKKTRQITMIKIMEDDINLPEERRNSRSALWKGGKSSSSKQIHPTNSTTSDFYHESAMLDTHRLALDDDESMSSRVMLFAAQSQEANDVDNPTDAIDMYATVDSARSRSTQSYDVTVDNPLDTIAAPPKTSQDIYIGVEETELNTDQRLNSKASIRADSEAALSDNTVYELEPEISSEPIDIENENNIMSSRISVKNQSKLSLREQAMSRATLKTQSQGSLAMHEVPPNAPDDIEVDMEDPQPDINDVNIASSKVSVRSSKQKAEIPQSDLIDLDNGGSRASVRNDTEVNVAAGLVSGTR